MNYKYITEIFLQSTIDTGNYPSLSNPKCANLCLKCTKIRLAATPPGPAGGASPLAATWMATSKEREGRGHTYKRMEGEVVEGIYL